MNYTVRIVVYIVLLLALMKALELQVWKVCLVMWVETFLTPLLKFTFPVPWADNKGKK